MIINTFDFCKYMIQDHENAPPYELSMLNVFANTLQNYSSYRDCFWNLSSALMILSTSSISM